MSKYTVRLSKANGSKLFLATVEANTEHEAFLKTVALAEEKGINVPDEVWSRIKQIQ